MNFVSSLSRIMPDMRESHPMPWLLVLAGCIGMFSATSTGSTRAPFLTDMAADFSVSLPAVANLFGLTATTWGVSSYLVGAASDRYGRRIFLLASPALLALTMLGASLAGSYSMLIVMVALAAICCGAFTSTLMAEVSLQTADSHQGRALGFVMSGQSLTLLFGIPVAAWLGASIGWRGTHAALAGLAIFAACCMAMALYVRDRSSVPLKRRSNEVRSLRDVLTGPVVRLFSALVAERLCFGLATFYYASYLRTVYAMPISAVALPLALFAVGNIVGTIIGGQIADRFTYRRVNFAVALLISGALGLPWFLLQSNVNVTIVIGVLFAFFNALSRPSLLAALADVPAADRGVIMGLNSSVASMGWLMAALLGGWLYSGIGFAGFGPVIAFMCLVATAVVLPDSRIRARQTS